MLRSWAFSPTAPSERTNYRRNRGSQAGRSRLRLGPKSLPLGGRSWTLEYTPASPGFFLSRSLSPLCCGWTLSPTAPRREGETADDTEARKAAVCAVGSVRSLSLPLGGRSWTRALQLGEPWLPPQPVPLARRGWALFLKPRRDERDFERSRGPRG